MEHISDIFYEDNTPYRWVNGRKIEQIVELSDEDRDLNNTINRVRASGLDINTYFNIRFN